MYPLSIVFRKAGNGGAYLDKVRALGISVTLVTQVLEAELGFGSVVATKRLEPTTACVWDSGGASFQITSLDDTTPIPTLRSYMGSWGTSISMAALVENVQGRNFRDIATVNPVSVGDAGKLIELIVSKLEEVPAWLQNKEVVFSAAGANSLFKLCCDVLTDVRRLNHLDRTGTEVTAEINSFTSFGEFEAFEALSACVEHTDAELMKHVSFPYADGPHCIVPKLALLVAVMRHTGIQKVEIVPCIGSCAGLLCDSRFWPPSV